MPTGPGSLDAQGVWQFGQDDTEALASDLHNIGQESISTQFGIDRARMTTIEADVTALEAQTGDTGWIALTLTNTATVYASKTPAYRVRHGVCYLRGAVSANTGSNSKFTLPAGARPSMEISVLLREGTGATAGACRIQTDGQTILAASANLDLSGVPPFLVS